MLSGRDIAGNMRTSIISFEVIEEVHEAELVVISGRIVDSDGNPVGGARIESGTGKGAISDSGGYFFIEMERGIVTLTITRKGYKDVYINIDARYDGNESLDDIVMEKEREEDNDSALVELFRSNTYCQVCCGALIIVPIFLMLLGLLARSRSRSRKRREYEE
ncbi:MAG TPA: carboxypeptidase regulatory-like domain-containing protein [Euryarchaeota archaeon]|nr:carboxypeptidase regulatory-like domain-containing protein [Euryarchaeota archaeon]